MPRPRAAPRTAGALADLRRGELVGLRARIVRSCNPGIVGASGTVVGETMNMLVLSPQHPAPRGAEDCGIRGGGRRRGLPGMRGPYRSYPKAGSVWLFGATVAGQDGGAPECAEIDGSMIARRPEDRLRAKPPRAHVAGGRQSGGACA